MNLIFVLSVLSLNTQLHQIQYLGTHNSYKRECWVNGTLADATIDMSCQDAVDANLDILVCCSGALFGVSFEELITLIQSVGYEHPDLQHQLDVGVRFLEFDVHYKGTYYGPIENDQVKFPVYHIKVCNPLHSFPSHNPLLSFPSPNPFS